MMLCAVSSSKYLVVTPISSWVWLGSTTLGKLDKLFAVLPRSVKLSNRKS